jgi:XTP/dITP diphosphohydrolase
MKYVFATGNKGKVKEINAIFEEKGIHVTTPGDYGLPFDPEETGTSFTDNAIIKAKACAGLIGGPTVFLADDSGLCIDALDGAPGVYSARWLGEDTPYTEKNKKILEMLAAVPDAGRTARFICAIAAVLPDGNILTSFASLEGQIAETPRGENGFGYDPIFFLPLYNKTTAELMPEEKNKISHRGQALRMMLTKLL